MWVRSILLICATRAEHLREALSGLRQQATTPTNLLQRRPFGGDRPASSGFELPSDRSDTRTDSRGRDPVDQSRIQTYIGLRTRSTSKSLLHIFTFGPFSAVSTPIFGSKYQYSFFCIFRDLQDVHSFAPLQFQQFSKFSPKFLMIF